MTAAAALDLAAEVADAHATASLAAADHIDVSFSSGGLAFTAKRQPDALARVEARLSPVRQQITLTGTTPRPWTVDVVNSVDLKSRLAGLRSPSRRLRWQPEDLGVFAAAAIWTYLTLPVLLHRAEHLHRQPDAAGVRRLRVTLPATLAGHGSVQTLHVGPDSLICRHDYTATAFGAWARRAEDHLVPDLRWRTHRHNPHCPPAIGTAAARPDARLDRDPLGAGGQTRLSPLTSGGSGTIRRWSDGAGRIATPRTRQINGSVRVPMRAGVT